MLMGSCDRLTVGNVSAAEIPTCLELTQAVIVFWSVGRHAEEEVIRAVKFDTASREYLRSEILPGIQRS